MSESQTTTEVGRADIRVASEPKINPEVIRGIASGIVGETKKLSPSVRRAIKALGNKEAEEALQMVAGEVLPFGKEEVKHVLLENLSSQDRDPKTGQKKVPNANTPEHQRYEETNKTAEAISEYLENPQNEPPSDLKEIVKSYLSISPAFRELIIDQQGNYTTGADPKQGNYTNADLIAKTLLRQPKVREMIRRLYVERLDPSKRLDHEKEVVRLRQEIEGIKEELGYDIAELIKEKQDDLTILMMNIQSDPSYRPYDEKVKRLGNLNRKKQILEEQLKRWKASRPAGEIKNDEIEAKIAEINSNLTVVEENINKTENELEMMRNDPNSRELFNRIQQATQLQQEIAGLQQQQKSIDPKRRNELMRMLAEKQAQLQEAESLLLAERIKYAGKIQSITPEALKSYLDEAFQTARDSYIEQTKKSNNEALNQAIDKITAQLGRKKAKKGGRETYVADKKKAGELLQQLLTPDGVERLFDPKNGELRLNENYLKTTYGMTTEEAGIFIQEVTNDPEYRHQVASKMAAAVFSDYILKGGRFSQDVVLAMTSTEWGNRLLEEGQALVQEKRQKLENLFGKGVISRFDELKGKSGEWIKQNWWKVGLAILFILLLLGGKAALGT